MDISTSNEKYFDNPSKPSFTMSYKITEENKDDEEQLSLIFEGKSINCAVVNTLRCILLTSIPVYGYHRSNVVIEKNTSVLNNDIMKGCFENLPIFNVLVTADLISPASVLSNDVLKELYGNYIEDTVNDLEELKEKELNPNKDEVSIKYRKIEILFNFKNKTDKIMFMNTHHAKFFIDNKESDNYKDKPSIAFLKLKPGEEFIAKATATLGISSMHTCWDAIGPYTYNYDNNSNDSNDSNNSKETKKFYLSFYTLGQISTLIIFQKACTIIIKKLRNLKNFIKNKYSDMAEKRITFLLHNETLIIPNLISYTLKHNPNVVCASSKKEHYLMNDVIISYEVNDSVKKTINPFIEVVDYLIDLYSQMIDIISEQSEAGQLNKSNKSNKINKSK
jgi:hypothetical protein